MLTVKDFSTPVFREADEDGVLHLYRHPGQTRAALSKKRFVVVFAGTQGGKTCWGPHWLLDEIISRGAGDYLVVTASFPLLDLKLLPEFREVFEYLLGLGTFRETKRVFVVSKEGEVKLFGGEQDTQTRIIFGSATNPESIESATAKAAWLDEAGQKQFRRESWEAIQRRLSIHTGRVLFTTTLYNLGWLKNEIYDRWQAGNKDIDVIQFKSTENPAFPQEEYDRAKTVLPLWKFKMFYEGEYDKPAGLIYDAFNEETCKVRRFKLPEEWPRYVGMDFGTNNMAALWYAQDPATHTFYLYREYLMGGMSSGEHAKKLIRLSQGENIVKCCGGSHQEQLSREAFTGAGWKVSEPRLGRTNPQNSVEIGIDRVYELHRLDRIVVFDDLPGYYDEKLSYSRELDDDYNPTEKIDNKAKYHFMDCERYILSEAKPETNITGAIKAGIQKFHTGKTTRFPYW